MILEVADIRIQPGQQAQFEQAIEHGLKTVINRAPEMHGWKVNHGVESPERYLLTIFWTSVEDHDAFRTSPLFAEWRAIIGPFFAERPVVEHFTLVVKSD